MYTFLCVTNRELFISHFVRLPCKAKIILVEMWHFEVHDLCNKYKTCDPFSAAKMGRLSRLAHCREQINTGKSLVPLCTCIG